jgi:hypothetical protein
MRFILELVVDGLMKVVKLAAQDDILQGAGFGSVNPCCYPLPFCSARGGIPSSFSNPIDTLS